MNPLARARHLLARRPWLYWLAVGLLAGTAAFAVLAVVGDLDAARRAWGDDRPVLVAMGEIEPGEPLQGRVEVRSRPGPAVPPSALSALPAGATARQHVAAGEAIVALDVAAGPGPQALIPEGWLAVAVREVVPTGVAAGDRVGAVSGGVVLADDGVVVDATAEAVLVAVPAADAPTVAAAATSGDLALLVVP